MANEYEGMSLEDLEVARDDLQAQMDSIKQRFRAAGIALEKARASTPKAKALKKLHDATAELASLQAEVSDG